MAAHFHRVVNMQCSSVLRNPHRFLKWDQRTNQHAGCCMKMHPKWRILLNKPKEVAENKMANKTNDKVLLEVNNLKKYFDVSGGLFKSQKKYLTAVDDISFEIKKGETFGLVGESGCGKTTAGRTILRLYDITDGSVVMDGTDISNLSQKQLLPFRKKMQMIFQDPYEYLSPWLNIQNTLAEPLQIHNLVDTEEELLKRIHDAWINIYIGVKFLNCN